MGDMGDYFRDWKEHFRDIRSNAKEKRFEFLRKSNINYEILNESIGHVRITTKKAKYDVWLGTGKWTKLGSNRYHQGWMDLLKRVGQDRIRN